MLFRLIKTVELDPSKNYLFGSHPHGLLASGSSTIYNWNSIVKGSLTIFKWDEYFKVVSYPIHNGIPSTVF